MEYVRVVNKADLADKRMLIVDVGQKEVLLANVGGVYYAVANKCPHLGGSLAHGTLEGTCIRCPRHGALFDLQTGRNLEGTRIGFVKVKVHDVECFPVKLEGEEILVGTERVMQADW